MDGRNNLMHRNPIVKTSVITHLPGSSYVSMEY